MRETDIVTNRPQRMFNVPAPAFRPGDPSEYRHMERPGAGALDRPAVDAPAATMREMPYGLIRVLDEEGKATGPWNPRLEPERLVAMLRNMALTDRKSVV